MGCFSSTPEKSTVNITAAPDTSSPAVAQTTTAPEAQQEYAGPIPKGEPTRIIEISSIVLSSEHRCTESEPAPLLQATSSEHVTQQGDARQAANDAAESDRYQSASSTEKQHSPASPRRHPPEDNSSADTQRKQPLLETADDIPFDTADTHASQSSRQQDSLASARDSTGGPGSGSVIKWEERKSNFKMCPAKYLLADVSNLSYLGSGGNSSVFKAHWHSSTVALKLFASRARDFQKSAGFYEALLGQELSHPNLVRCFETRCSELTPAFVKSVVNSKTPIRFDRGLAEEPYAKSKASASPGAGTAADGGAPRASVSGPAPSGSGQGLPSEAPFESGDGFGAPDAFHGPPHASSVPITWKELMRLVNAEPGDYLSVVILQFCDMGNLATAISRGVFQTQGLPNPEEGRLRYRALLRTVREVAQGLDHLHRMDVVHGDVKPSSIMLHGSRTDRRGFSAQLIRYGLSRIVEGSKQRSASLKGTICYLAPEQFGGQLSKASDIYAFGIVLWEMLTGLEPYKGKHQGAIMMGVQTGKLRPPWPETLDVGPTTEQMKALYLRCMDQEPSNRPTAEEVVNSLIQIESALRSELAKHNAAVQRHAATWAALQAQQQHMLQQIAAQQLRQQAEQRAAEYQEEHRIAEHQEEQVGEPGTP